MLDTQMPRNSQRDDEEIHKVPTIEQALIAELKKANESLVKALREAADKIELNRDSFYSGQMFVNKYRTIADKYEVK